MRIYCWMIGIGLLCTPIGAQQYLPLMDQQTPSTPIVAPATPSEAVTPPAPATPPASAPVVKVIVTHTPEPASAPSAAPTAPSNAITARIKDIAHVRGARDNQLIGYGLVGGLNGTGDSQNTVFTANTVTSILSRLGVVVPSSNIRIKNVAAVMVTADIGPYLKSGDRIDVTVSSLGDATSLQGGTLLQTPLMGGDGRVYAVAQGAISLGGYSVTRSGSSTMTAHPTAGRIPNGALVEREIPSQIITQQTLAFSLTNPDFATAARVAAVIQQHVAENGGAAEARDAATIEVTIPPACRERIVEFIGELGELSVAVDMPAKVVLNERTGTVVIGGNAMVLPVALAQGDLTITVSADFAVSQPAPLSEGETVTKRTAAIEVKEPQVSLTQVRGSTVDELVRTLNQMRVSPRDIIAILQALKTAGALQAELVVM